MTNEEVMQLMTDMGLCEVGMDDWVFDNAWVKFANAVASAERNACAALCFAMWEKWMDADPSERGNLPRDAEDCAHAIRARGQA